MGQVFAGIGLAFAGRARIRSLTITLVLGSLLTAFYLVMLPSSAVGGLAFVAVHYLTPLLALAAIVLGYGFALTVAINVSSFTQRSRAAGVVGVGGLLAAVLPGSLCCTSVVPSLLAALGASTPTILGTTGKIQSVFANYESAFIGASVAAVVLSIVLAARNHVSSCSTT
jgi:hypothetical protein